LHGTRDVFDWNVRIHAMLIKEINYVGLEAFQRSLSHRPDSFRLAVGALAWDAVFETKFCCDDDFVAKRGQCLADKFFVRKRPVRFGSIKERHAAVKSRANYLDGLILFQRRAKAETQSHATEAQGRNFQPAFSQCALLHWILLSWPIDESGD